MWHRLRNALHEKDEGRKPEERREFSHAVTDLIQAFRDSDRAYSAREADRFNSGQ